MLKIKEKSQNQITEPEAIAMLKSHVAGGCGCEKEPNCGCWPDRAEYDRLLAEYPDHEQLDHLEEVLAELLNYRDRCRFDESVEGDEGADSDPAHDRAGELFRGLSYFRNLPWAAARLGIEV